jgi:hypothetical protein
MTRFEPGDIVRVNGGDDEELQIKRVDPNKVICERIDEQYGDAGEEVIFNAWELKMVRMRDIEE